MTPMHQDTCDSLALLISTYVDGETTDQETQIVEQHIAACPACTRYLAFLQVAHQVWENPPVEVPTSDLAARIAAATYARPRLHERIGNLLRPAPARFALGSALAAGLAATLLLTQSGHEPRPLLPNAPMVTDSTGKTQSYTVAPTDTTRPTAPAAVAAAPRSAAMEPTARISKTVPPPVANATNATNPAKTAPPPQEVRTATAIAAEPVPAEPEPSSRRITANTTAVVKAPAVLHVSSAPPRAVVAQSAPVSARPAPVQSSGTAAEPTPEPIRVAVAPRTRTNDPDAFTFPSRTAGTDTETVHQGDLVPTASGRWKIALGNSTRGNSAQMPLNLEPIRPDRRLSSSALYNAASYSPTEGPSAKASIVNAPTGN